MRLAGLARLRPRPKTVAGSVLALAAAAYALAWAVPMPARLSAPPSTVVTYRDGSPAYVFLSPDDKVRMAVDPERLWGDDAEVDPRYLEALLRFEDKRFGRHPGVDLLAVLRSIAVNLWHRRALTGASTITMQLVRVLEPRPRTLGSKVVESLRSLQLELRMSKREILAAYLTFIPFGRNLEGVAAASWAYFGHGPAGLAIDEIAVLLAVPQRPTSRHPRPENAERLREGRDEIAAWLLDHDAFPEARSAAARAELAAEVAAAPVPTAFRPLPRDAAHAAFWLLQRGAPRGLARLETTLDRGVQRIAERALTSAGASLAALGIRNGAAVLADHRTGEIQALVGNFDFFDDENGGQIPGFDVGRSPGSALKPFVYALALDRGLALPEQLVADTPIVYGDYAPENYDGDFTGLIRLEDALSLSLNVPFVVLLQRLGVERFIGALRTGGALHLDDRAGFYGLSAALGSVEVTPLEVAGLYAALAEDGRYRPLRLLREEPELEPVALFGPGAAWLTRRALARRDRPDFPSRGNLAAAPPRIHWKTGTSYGHRDAWAVGSGPETTAAVWLGNFDNRPSFDLVGADAAGPILFDLLEAVRPRGVPPPAEPRAADLRPVEVCAYSGYLPSRACRGRTHALALAAHVPTESCPYHVAIDVDLDSGRALNPTCRGGRRWETRSYLVWPASIRRFLARSGRFMETPPALAADCADTRRRRPPEILTPPSGQVLVLLPGVPADRQEVPLEAEAAGAGTLSWFVDGLFLGTVPTDERLWWTPSPGVHEIVVTDGAGQSAKRRLQVLRRVG